MSISESISPATIDSATLRELLGSGRRPRVLDVRTPAEFESVTNSCAMGRLPVNRGGTGDLDTVVGQLREAGRPAGSGP